METVTATDFKARCLAILDQVRATGERITILKRGEPVAELGPVTRTDAKHKYPQHELMGTAHTVGDIISPAVPEEDWESLAR